ncbi:unnamed protein product [Meloidogyne enterolobii]|uniref:Uncharacterized protein n=1 Tax=Meloidogyne enterolobii TaxID=390850 RepID=A0ACB1B0V4_MELEN
MLVPYLYGPEFTSQLARDALLLIMSASSKNEFIAEHIIQKGDLCHVMSAGLSACFSQLPKCVFSEFALDSNEAHKLSVFDVKGMPQLYEFHNALLFTNSVARIAHYSITRQIVHFIYTGFLLKVFKSSIVERGDITLEGQKPNFFHFWRKWNLRILEVVFKTASAPHLPWAAQSYNLLQDLRITPNLVLNDSSHRAKEIGTKIDKGQKFSSKLWLCDVMDTRLFGRSEPKEEELCSRIVYFHLCIETISATALLQAFMKILLTTSTNVEEKSEEEEMNLFEQILVKMHEITPTTGVEPSYFYPQNLNLSNYTKLSQKQNFFLLSIFFIFQLCRVTLSLIRTLLSLHCEDFLWSTIFRHLLPFIQLRHPNQSRRFDANISLNSANYFLKCIPECAKNVLELCSEEQFETYLREAGKSIRDCEECCSCWALKYDGSLPKCLLCNPQKLINSEGMIVTPRQAFTRHSSARSSFASTGWNRYGHSNRSGRGTLLEGELESNNTNLNSLGEDDEQLTNLIERLEDGNEVINNLSSQEEFGEASVLNENEDNRPDYFQFIYDRVSESDLDSFSRRNSEEDSQEEFLSNKKQKNILATKINNNSNSDSEKRQSNLSINLIKQQQPTLSPFMSAVVQTNWNEAKNDRNKFINLLNLLPTRSSNNENKLLIEDLSLIDARWQHLEELRIEKLELTQQMSKEPNPFRLNLEGESGGEEVFLNINGGILMKSTEEKGAGILLESLFDILSNLTENSFNTNIQLLGVFNLLFSYPQPLLTAYLFYVDSLRGNLPLLKINDVSLFLVFEFLIGVFVAIFKVELFRNKKNSEFENITKKSKSKKTSKIEIFKQLLLS